MQRPGTQVPRSLRGRERRPGGRAGSLGGVRIGALKALKVAQ